MSIDRPFPELDEFLEAIGDAGRRLSEIDASEGAAGNISVYLGWNVEPRRRFSNEKMIQLPIPVPELSGGSLLITGSGRRLRDIAHDPTANLGFLRISAEGQTGTLFTSATCLFSQLTSELNSHLAVHRDQVSLTGTNFHAFVHAQPIHITYLSHIPKYQNTKYLNQHLLRWQPEIIINLPEGIGFVPFHVPGSQALMADTLTALRNHRVVLWSKHGVVARSDVSVKRAVDRIEYAETGARYEVLNLNCNEPADGLKPAEIQEICMAFNVQQNYF
jgi:rhamnulose-1-phosphate aldolase